MKKVLFYLACVLAVLQCAPALAAENLLTNGDFETVLSNGYPERWSTQVWYDGSSALSLSGDAYLGQYCVKVENYSENDARFAQTVAVEPGAVYKISAMIRAEDCATDAQGATISIADTFVGTQPLYDTQGEWVSVSFYGQAAQDQTEVTVMARVGGYGSLNTGTAWFDDVRVEKVENEVVDGDIASLATVPPSDGQGGDYAGEDEAFSGDEGLPGVAAILLGGAICALALAAFALWGGRRPANALNARTPRLATAAGVLALAFVVRALIAMLVRGYEVDMNCFEGWAARAAQVGLSNFYSADAFCDYPPGYIYVLWALGALRSALGIGSSAVGYLIIKLPAILCDLAVAALLYKMALSEGEDEWALVVLTVYAFNPVTILDSAAWGQIDAVLTALLLVSMMLAVRRQWRYALPVFALTALVKPQALMLAPLGVAVVVFELIRTPAENRRRAIIEALVSTVLSLALMALLSLPYMLGLSEELLSENAYIFGVRAPEWMRPLVWLINQYGGTMSYYASLTVNACNLYTLLDLNWSALEIHPALSAFAWAMLALSYAYAFYLYYRARDGKKLFLIAGTLLALLFAFGPMMHERYLFPALAFLLAAYLFDRDVRVLAALSAFTFSQFSNIALVLRSEHLLPSEQLVNAGVSLLTILSTALLSYAAWDICVRGRVVSFTRRYTSQKNIQARRAARENQLGEALFKPRDARLNMRAIDWALMLGLTLIYSVVAFFNLGTTKAPQTSWMSVSADEEITFDLGQVQSFHMTYYGGICDVDFKVQWSDDGEVWSKEYYAEYDQGEIFRWLWFRPMEEDEETGAREYVNAGYELISARYIRLIPSEPGLVLSEVAFLDESGQALPITRIRHTGGDEDIRYDAKQLVDEQDTVPAYPSYYNGTYFDEIYHARTAYEHLHGLSAYEWTHPPLGKVLIMLGIELFGMTPFGWRFMGTLFGVLMIPAIYLLGKQLLKRTEWAFLAAFLLAVDCMHFTQTRIATIDTYPVFFIIVMYLFMLRYTQMSFYHVKLRRTLAPLGLSGLFMGFAIASKWIGIYAAIGLAVLFFHTLIVRTREYLYAKRNLDKLDANRRRVAQRVVKVYGRSVVETLCWCVIFFIVIPALIYYFSYYWQLTPTGEFNLKGVWETQVSMFKYHAGLGDDNHSFRSPWYEWPLIVRPMWYYTGNAFMETGWVSSISCMGNPVVWWGGLVSLIFVLVRYVISLVRSIKYNERTDRRYLFVLIGFLSQYLPWVLVPRSTFIYHYFASVPFIILATALMFEWVRRKNNLVYRVSIGVYCVGALALFIAFYPLMSGTPIPLSYARYLRWFNWYNY